MTGNNCVVVLLIEFKGRNSNYAQGKEKVMDFQSLCTIERPTSLLSFHQSYNSKPLKELD
jgi:hypothetical protein